MAELSILFPDAQDVDVMGKKVEVRGVKLRDLERFGKLSSAVLTLMSSCTVENQAKFAKESAGDIAKVISLSTNLTHWRAMRLPASVALELFGIVMQVNHRFFTGALAGAAKALGGRMQSSG